jgi:hypothetical protein
MSTVDTHHRHTTPWIASAAAACILAAAGVAGVAWQQHKGEASPSAPGTPSVVTYPLQNYPIWRTHGGSTTPSHWPTRNIPNSPLPAAEKSKLGSDAVGESS